MKQAIIIIRAMNIEGRHLHGCFINPEIRQQGWRLMQRARRIARRLGWEGLL